MLFSLRVLVYTIHCLLWLPEVSQCSVVCWKAALGKHWLIELPVFAVARNTGSLVADVHIHLRFSIMGGCLSCSDLLEMFLYTYIGSGRCYTCVAYVVE